MSLSELCSNMISNKEGRKNLIDKSPLEFMTAPWGLGLGSSHDVPPLYPAQRFIIKIYYGLELDNGSNRDIIINDKFNEKELYRFNESEYMEYLYNEGRLNRLYENRSYENLILVCGRRAGKTSITSCIIAFELYKLLNKYCPQEYYNIMPEDPIKFTCISTSKETASELFTKIVGHIERSEFFRKYRKKPTQQYVYFRTQRDLDKYGPNCTGSISIRVSPCSAKGLRGPGNMVVAFDELAFFFTDETKGKVTGKDKDDRAIYNAVTPSVAKFQGEDGSPHGKIVCISSPGPKSGKFYEEYERSFEEGNEDLLMLQAPTWEIDPKLSPQYLRRKYKENAIVFKSEFGAQFSDRLFGWIDDPEIVRQCIVPGLKPKSRSMERVPHYMGIDIGLKNDGTAISIGHWVNELVGGVREDFIEEDLSEVRYAHLENKDYFKPDELVDWILTYANKFLIIKGLMDQYYGMTFIPLFHQKGFKQFEYRQFTDVLNSNVYQVLLSAFISKQLRMIEGDKVKAGFEGTTESDSELVKEILKLQAEQKSKYIIKVSAPDRKDEHDDLSDGYARMVFAAIEHKNKGIGHISGMPTHMRQASQHLRFSRRSEFIKASLNRPSNRFMNRTASGRMGLTRSIRG